MPFFDIFRKRTSKTEKDTTSVQETSQPKARRFSLLTKAEVLAFGRDAITCETAELLSSPVRWFVVAESNGVLWGTYSREKKVVYSAVVLAKPEFHCSCAVKTKPCKHALALFLLASLYPDVILNRDVSDEHAKLLIV